MPREAWPLYEFVPLDSGTTIQADQAVPAALTAVMRENATRPDFAPEGSLALKPWFGEPAQMDRRLVAQSGLFVVPSQLQTPLCSILAKNSTMFDPPPAVV